MHGRGVAVQHEVDDQVQDAERQTQASAQAAQEHVFLPQTLGQGLELPPHSPAHRGRGRRTAAAAAA